MLLIWKAFALCEYPATVHCCVEELYTASPDHCQPTEPRGTGIEFDNPGVHIKYIVAEKFLISSFEVVESSTVCGLSAVGLFVSYGYVVSRNGSPPGGVVVKVQLVVLLS